MPAHPMQNVVYHCHWSIAHRFIVRTAVPDPLKLSKGFRRLLCHTSQLSQTLVSTISRHVLLRFVPHRAETTAVRGEMICLGV